ncbi:MAG: hypothetical protein C4570_07820 [Ammonifex sp.]|jgi:hypothetical protein|nr:MAG: hypothetical protein C4570_07820 [Ammonifex sp.]
MPVVNGVYYDEVVEERWEYKWVKSRAKPPLDYGIHAVDSHDKLPPADMFPKGYLICVIGENFQLYRAKHQRRYRRIKNSGGEIHA